MANNAPFTVTLCTEQISFSDSIILREFDSPELAVEFALQLFGAIRSSETTIRVLDSRGDSLVSLYRS